jgi:phosphohistidine phosphatase
MRLFVIRHGIAEDAAPGGDDPSRVLTPRGRARVRQVAAGLRALGVRWDALVTSPLPRAAETATILAEVVGGPAPQQLAALATGVGPPEMLRALRPFARHARVAIVGHEPGLSGLVALLLTGTPAGLHLDLKKAGAVALELDGLPPRSEPVLRWMMTPRQLRRAR